LVVAVGPGMLGQNYDDWWDTSQTANRGGGKDVNLCEESLKEFKEK